MTNELVQQLLDEEIEVYRLAKWLRARSAMAIIDFEWCRDTSRLILQGAWRKDYAPVSEVHNTDRG